MKNTNTISEEEEKITSILAHEGKLYCDKTKNKKILEWNGVDQWVESAIDVAVFGEFEEFKVDNKGEIVEVLR